MDATQNNKATDSLDATATQVADPFAVDLFAAPTATASGETTEAQGASSEDANASGSTSLDASYAAWHQRLPRVSIEQARLSCLPHTLPILFNANAQRTLARTLASFTNRRADADDAVSIELITARETELIIEANTSQIVFVNFTVEPGAGHLAFALPRDFAVRLIDCVLGGDGDTSDAAHSRELSVIEQAVIEFLCLNLAQQLNREAGSNLLRFDSVSNFPSAWLPTGTEKAQTEQDNRGVLLVAELAVAPNVECLARGFIPAATLRLFDASSNKLLRRSAQAHAHAKLRRFASLAPNVRLRLRIGETTLAAADVPEIERGDVVIITQAYADSGRARVFAGDDDNLQLAGRLQITRGASKIYAFKLEKIESLQPTPLRERWQMNEPTRNRHDEEAAWQTNNQAETDDAAAAAAEDAAARLENLMLTVHVELAARRISLDELAALAPEQIIELGCRPTDPVELVVEDRAVARGELVEIENRLGVRITQVLR